MKPSLVAVTRRRLALPSLALLVLLCLGACGGERLSELRRDPMASYEAEGIELRNEFMIQDGKSLVTGKPTYADLSRTYDIVDETMSDQILESALRAAEEAGWAVDNEFSFTSSTRFRKEFDWGDGSLSIGVGETLSGEPVLLLSLNE